VDETGPTPRLDGVTDRRITTDDHLATGIAA
jgi:hypothetical protein